MGASLHQRGHHPVVWSPSVAGTRALRENDLAASGVIEVAFRLEVADSIARALAAARAVVVALPANGHRVVLDGAVPHITPEHSVIISAQLSLGVLYLRRALEARGIDATVMAWGTTVVMGRRTGPAQVHVGGIRDRIEAAVLPAAGLSRVLASARRSSATASRPLRDFLLSRLAT